MSFWEIDIAPKTRSKSSFQVVQLTELQLIYIVPNQVDFNEHKVRKDCSLFMRSVYVNYGSSIVRRGLGWAGN